MRLATVDQARRIDQSHAPGPELAMESAGTLAAEHVTRLTRGPVTVLCGPGHNGADGLVIARHLHARGRDVAVHLVDGAHSELFARQLARLPVTPGPLRLQGTLVDALIGLGLSRPLDGPRARLVGLINGAPVTRIAIDVPSGLDADRGLGPAVCADHTLTFGLAKAGFFLNDGPAHVGRLHVLNIGYPRDVVKRTANTHALFTARRAATRLPRRARGANKTHFGHAVIIAGKPGSWGAGWLAADAAFRVGAGYVTWASFTAPDREIGRMPECFSGAVDDAKIWTRATAAAVGPGLGTGRATADVIERLKSRDLPVVVDADALTACVNFDLWPLPKRWVVTPHAGELARILGRAAGEIERDRGAAVRDACTRTGAVTVLKGFRTVVGDGTRYRIIDAGNAALAKAGTGDVLTGMITGLLAQGVDVFDAAATAAFAHGKVADDWVAEGLSPAALRAGDIGRRLPRTLAGLA